MLNLHFLLVNITSFLMKLSVNCSFDSENGFHRIICFRSSNNHSGIIKSSLSLLKCSIVFLMKFLGKPIDKKSLLVIRFTLKLKSLAILLALCNSPVIASRLYLVRIFEDQCTDSFLDLL